MSLVSPSALVLLICAASLTVSSGLSQFCDGSNKVLFPNNEARLSPGECLLSNNGQYQLLLGYDNVLSIFQTIGAACGQVVLPALWSTPTFNGSNWGTSIARLLTDGNFVLSTRLGESRTRTVMWQSYTSGARGTGQVAECIHVDDRGSLVLRSTAGTAIWRATPRSFASIQIPGEYCSFSKAFTVLLPGQALLPGLCRFSPNGRVLLVFQSDNNLALYYLGDQAQFSCSAMGTLIWSTGTANVGQPFGGGAEFQEGGNLAVFSKYPPGGPEDVVYTSNSGDHPDADCMGVLDNGELIVHSSRGGVIWTSSSTLPPQVAEVPLPDFIPPVQPSTPSPPAAFPFFNPPPGGLPGVLFPSPPPA